MKGLDEKKIQEMIDQQLKRSKVEYSREFAQKCLLVAYGSSAVNAVLSDKSSDYHVRTASDLVKDYKFLFNYSLPILNDNQKRIHREQIEELEKILGSSYS